MKPKVLEYINSTKRVSIKELREMAENAISFIERNPTLFAPTWKDLFKDAPDGEFEWKCEEAGDWIPSLDDDRWRKDAYGMDMGRDADGTEWIEFTEVDQDGNWETTGRWDKKPKERWGKGEVNSFSHEMAMQHCYYNCLKMELYNLYVAETGLDPIGDTLWFKKTKLPIGHIRKVHTKDVAYDIADLCHDVYKTAATKFIK